MSYPWLVVQTQWRDAALVILGHGSSVNEDSAAPVYMHAEAVRKRGLFAEVREAFWKQDPQVKNVLASLNYSRVFLVPLFISEGYFGGKVIPDELGFASGAEKAARFLELGPGRGAWYARAVGTHPLMRDIVLERAVSVLKEFPFPRAPRRDETTLLIAGHGTVQDKMSRVAVDEMANGLRSSAGFAAVHSVFLEESPRISQWHELAATRHVVVVPFFISEGMHTRQDIPVLLGETERAVRERLERGLPSWRNPTEKRGKLIWYSSSVGTHNRIADVILERVGEASEPGGTPQLAT